MATRARKTVFIILPQGGVNEIRVLAGVQDMARAKRFDLFVVECLKRKEGALQFIRSPGGGTFQELLESARPDGIIVTFNAIDPATLRQLGCGSIPTVFIDRPIGAASSGRTAPVSVFGEAESYAWLAAHELFRTGFDDYAFLPWPENPDWSRERGECFQRQVAEAGKRFHPFPPSRHGGAADLVTHLVPFLDSIPKPCGLFAANDGVGEAALRVCAMRGWAVPQEVAMIGVDNLGFICEMTDPTLSSVCRDLEGDGRAAAELLAGWMESPRRRPASRATPALRVERRTSTFFFADRRIAHAMEFIRLHACEEGFAPPSVVREMGLGRTQADFLFRRVAGRSILHAIHDARLTRAQDLLRSGKSASYAADTCGFGSIVDFSRAFKRLTGKTVREWTAEVRAESRG